MQELSTIQQGISLGNSAGTTDALYRYNYPSDGRCPNCGYCPHCGRHNNYPSYPSQPYFGDPAPMPLWNQNQFQAQAVPCSQQNLPTNGTMPGYLNNTLGMGGGLASGSCPQVY